MHPSDTGAAAKHRRTALGAANQIRTRSGRMEDERTSGPQRQGGRGRGRWTSPGGTSPDALAGTGPAKPDASAGTGPAKPDALAGTGPDALAGTDQNRGRCKRDGEGLGRLRSLLGPGVTATRRFWAEENNAMELSLSADEVAFREELRGYFRKMMTPELVEELTASGAGEGGGPEFRKAMRQMGRDGLLGLSWPREYGGGERSPIEQFLFADEIQAAGFPLPFLTLCTVGPMLQQYGTDEQRGQFCPQILAGELFFSIGYSEPSAGTDLASLRTGAVRDGDEWVINGQKMWTSLAQYADYVWLAARTDPDAPKHRGLSIFLVPTSSPGFSRQEICTVGGVKTNATFYDDVRVPAENLIGGENNGWRLITGQLNHERISLMTVGRLRRQLGEVAAWARATQVDGARVIDKPWVQHNLARLHAKVQVLRLMNWKQAWAASRGQPDMAESSAIKVYGSELSIEAYRALLEVLGVVGILGRESPGAVLRGAIESAYRNALILTFGGGTNEVQRDIIAMAGLGMPHYKE